MPTVGEKFCDLSFYLQVVVAAVIGLPVGYLIVYIILG